MGNAPSGHLAGDAAQKIAQFELPAAYLMLALMAHSA